MGIILFSHYYLENCMATAHHTQRHLQQSAPRHICGHRTTTSRDDYLHGIDVVDFPHIPPIVTRWRNQRTPGRLERLGRYNRTTRRHPGRSGPTFLGGKASKDWLTKNERWLWRTLFSIIIEWKTQLSSYLLYWLFILIGFVIIWSSVAKKNCTFFTVYFTEIFVSYY